MGKLFYQRLRCELKERQEQGNLRELPLVSYNGDNIVLDNMPYIDLSSNDYLGIARDPKFFSTFIQTMLDSKSTGSQFAEDMLMSAISAGSTGSRLLTGNHPAYYFAEDLLSSLFNGSMFSSICGDDEGCIYKATTGACSPDAAASGSCVGMSDLHEDKHHCKNHHDADQECCGKCKHDDDDHANSYAHGHDGSAAQDALFEHEHGSASANCDSLDESAICPVCGKEKATEQVSEKSSDKSKSKHSRHHDKKSSRTTASGRVPKSGGEIEDYHALADEEQRCGYKAPDVKARACLYLNSGFDANSGVLSALFGKKDLMLVDKLSHASIIDGMLHGEAKAIRYAHNDMQHLEQLLEKHAANYESVVIVTESVFSMDGDQAKLKEIVALKERYDNVLLYVDEAHSFGLFGDDGLGLCKELNLLDKVDFLMGTLGKAIGSHGAFLICSKEVKDYLVNFMRPLIFSTALPPVNITFSTYVIGLLRAGAMQYKREYLRKISGYLHSNLKELGIMPSQSQIQPLITGDSKKALEASQIFRDAGLLAMPIRHPTVPENKARLRLSLNCNLRIDDIELITQLVERHMHLFVQNA